MTELDSPPLSLVSVEYAVSDVMRPLAASSSRGLSCDNSPPRYPSPLPHVFVMFLICCFCVEVFFAIPYTVPPLEEHSLGYLLFFDSSCLAFLIFLSNAGRMFLI